MEKHQHASDFVRVSRSYPCPVCDHDHWCYFFGDMTAVVCMRVESERPTRRGEGWIHVLEEVPQERTHTYQTFESVTDANRADPKTLDKVYRTLTSQLHLDRPHRANLMARGLNESEILSLGYVSLPDGLRRLPAIKSCIDLYGEKLLSVPGFYLTEKKRIWLAGQDGMLIPCRDVDGHLTGAQIRINSTDGSGKYRWMSATQKQRKRGGVSSGTPIHVAGRHLEANRVWITEGILKADIASLKLGQPVIGLAGVSSWKTSDLHAILKKLGPQSIAVAFDADAKTNKQVRHAEKKLTQALLSMGYCVEIADWDTDSGKGIDDLLVNGHRPRLTRYSPRVEIESLKDNLQRNAARSIRIERIKAEHSPVENPSRKGEEEISIEQIRQMTADKIQHVSLAEGGAYLFRLAPGMGKTFTTIAVEDQLWRAGQLRPVYAAPRHELIEQNQQDGWFSIRPRQPMTQAARDLAPHQGLVHIQSTIDQGHSILDLSELSVLCYQWEPANQLGAQRWSVPKNLCTTDCEIGQTYGAPGCPYFMQYRVEPPIATVHETLFVPQFCQDIFGNPQLEFYGSPRQVCIIDEPAPAKFRDTIEINTTDLGKAIVDAWDKDLRTLIEIVRAAAESVARREDRTRTLGRESMQELVDHAGGEDKLGKLLDSASAEAPSKHEKVVVAIDMFIDEKPKSWKVLIDGEVCYLPKAFADPIDGESMKVVKGYAIREQLPVIRDFEGDLNDIPLNFQFDLLTVLQREFSLFQKGRPYNSALVFEPLAIRPTVRLNLRRHFHVPKEVPILLLDAQGDPQLLSRLLGREVETWEINATPDAEIMQIVDGMYGITSLWNGKQKKPTRTLERLLDKVVFPIAQSDPAHTLIVTWKKVADYLRELQDAGEISPLVAIEHYGNLSGSNAYESRKNNILLGTPQLSPNDLEEMAHALFITGEAPISAETEMRWEKYAYQDCDGYGYQVKVRRYIDQRVNMLAKLQREHEILQAAHRTRPLLHDGRRIFLLTALPIPSLPPTRLMTVDDLAASLGEMPVGDRFTKAVGKGVIERCYEEGEGMFCTKDIKAALQQAFFTLAKRNSLNTDEKRQLWRDFPSDATIWRWIREVAQELGLERTQVIVDRYDRPDNGKSASRPQGVTWFYVYHRCDLTEDEVRAMYALEVDIEPVDRILLSDTAYPSDRETRADESPTGLRAEWGGDLTWEAGPSDGSEPP